MKTIKALAALLAAGALVGAGQANAAVDHIVNGSFEAGLTGWMASLPANAVSFAPPGGLYNPSNSGSLRTYAPLDGARFAVVEGAGRDVAVTLSQTFQLTAANTLSGFAAFVTFDFDPFVDDVSLDLVSALGTTNLFNSNVLAVGNYGDTPWTSFQIDLGPGLYTLVGRSTNRIDGTANSQLLLDDVRLANDVGAAAVPEPATWAMMIGGFFGAGSLVRRRRSVLA